MPWVLLLKMEMGVSLLTGLGQHSVGLRWESETLQTAGHFLKQASAHKQFLLFCSPQQVGELDSYWEPRSPTEPSVQDGNQAVIRQPGEHSHSFKFAPQSSGIRIKSNMNCRPLRVLGWQSGQLCPTPHLPSPPQLFIREVRKHSPSEFTEILQSEILYSVCYFVSWNPFWLSTACENYKI